MEKVEVDKEHLYVANQARGQFDELQRLTIAYLNGQPVAIEGEPGLGKNQALSFLAHALGKDTYRIRCTEEMMARDIIGGEKLAVERTRKGAVATKTQFEPGKLLKGLQEGKFVILDEVNQLTPTVQKALNSVLEDTRTLGNLEGGVDVKAKDGFGLFLTYNPETGVANDDLEVAVKDRCKLLYFDHLPAELKARIALLKTKEFCIDDFLGDGMEMRGLQLPNGSLGFVQYTGSEWQVYGNGKIVTKGKVTPYLYFDRDRCGKMEFKDERKDELYQIASAMVRCLDDLKELREQGTAKAKRDLGLRHLDDVGRLNLNASSPRLTNKLLEDYVLLRGGGYEPGQVLGDIATTIVDCTVPAAERGLQIGENLTIAGLVEHVCAGNGLMTNSMLHEIKNRTRDYSKERMCEDLMQKGLGKKMAQRLVEEYAR